MVKASDNTFPRLQLTTGVATTAPTGGLWELRARADGIYAVSSNTGSAGTGPLGAAGSGVSSGTSNPGSPVSGDLYFRTDLGLLIYYDGTRWLTVNEYSVTVPVYETVAPYTATASLFVTTDNATYEQWITRLVATTILTNGTTSANYITVQLTSQPASGASSNIGSSFSCQNDTQNNNVKHTVTIGAAVTTAHTRLNVVMTEVGTASWYCFPIIYYRRIVT